MKNLIKLCAVAILIIVMISACVVVSSAATTTATEEEWIEIRTIEDLYNVRNDLSANYILMNDIDLTEATAPGGAYDYQGYGWNPITDVSANPDTPFSGVFDGNGHKIIGMRIVASGGTKGLFKYIKGGTVKNLGMVNGCIEGSGSTSFKTGFIAGYVYGACEIYNCYNTGTISIISDGANSMDVGGLIGEIGYTSGEKAIISNCYNTGDITVDSNSSQHFQYVGGILGNGHVANDCSIKINNCYNTGNVGTNITTSYTSWGGICGQLAGASGTITMQDCYSIGNTIRGICGVGNNTSISMSSCYYYGSTYSGTQEGAVLNTSQISNKSMYTGFDFENDWIIDNNANYPYPQLRSNPQDLSKTIESVNLGSLPTKTNYLTGDDLDLTGGHINVKYSSGLAGTEQLSITEDMVSGFDSNKIAKQTLTITYKGQTWNYTIDMACRHDFSAKNTDNIYFKSAATCTSAEKYYYSCSNCGEIGTESFDNGVPLPHTFTEQITTSDYLKSLANCIEPAIFYYSCECGEKGNETFTVGSPTTHTYDREIIPRRGRPGRP